MSLLKFTRNIATTIHKQKKMYGFFKKRRRKDTNINTDQTKTRAVHKYMTVNFEESINKIC